MMKHTKNSLAAYFAVQILFTNVTYVHLSHLPNTHLATTVSLHNRFFFVISIPMLPLLIFMAEGVLKISFNPLFSLPSFQTLLSRWTRDAMKRKTSTTRKSTMVILGREERTPALSLVGHSNSKSAQ